MQVQDSLVDTDELQAFDAVATRHSFSLAAAQLGCSQSTVSQRIARLEKRLDRMLIRRTTRQVSLTPEGEAMLIYARTMLNLAEDVRVRLARPTMKGVLKVGIEDEFATTRLPRVLGIFLTQYPDFALKFVTGRNEHLRDVLREHKVDIILGKSHSDYGGEVLWRERLVWMGRPTALKKADRSVPVIAYLGTSVTRDMVESALLANRRAWVNVAECSNLLGKIAVAEAGLGVMAIGRSFRAPGLVEFSDDAGLPSLGTLDYMLEGVPAEADPAIDAFRKVLGEAAKQVAHEESFPAKENE